MRLEAGATGRPDARGGVFFPEVVQKRVDGAELGLGGRRGTALVEGV